MNKILFDLTATQPIGGTKRHGGAKYGEIVLKKIYERNLPIICYYDSKKWINPEIEALVGKSNLWDINEYSLSDLVKKTGCNAIYSALPQLQLFNFKDCKVIGTIHGLRRLETPADSYCFLYKNMSFSSRMMFMFQKIMPSLYKRMLCKYKEKEWQNPNFQFVTVSEHSACSLKTFFPRFKDIKIPVFYSPSTSPEANIETVYTEKFFMLVSGNRSDKNNLRAIKAFDMLFDNGFLIDYKVKITGAKSASNYRYKIRNKEHFEFMGYVDDNILEQLYHDAYALVYPSLNEGFGYPPLEAMHYGTPVVASPYASIPEVCEGAAIYFNPFSIEEIANRILRITDERVRIEYANRANLQYKKVTARQKRDLEALVDFLYE